jgi:hypothetical protein
MVTIKRDSSVKLDAAGWLDRMGAATSTLCALHCALLPTIGVALPLVGLGLLAEERTEAALIGASVALGTISLGLGFRRHRSGRALIVLAIGLGMLALGRFAEAGDAEHLGVVAVVSGGIAIAGSHLLNHRLCRPCPTCSPDASGLAEGLGGGRT